jgi:hypothetical protein
MTTPDPLPPQEPQHASGDAAQRAPFQKIFVYGPAPLPRASVREIASAVLVGAVLIGIATAGIFRLSKNAQAENSQPARMTIVPEHEASAPAASRYAPGETEQPMPPPPARPANPPTTTRIFIPQPPSPYDSFNRSPIARQNGLVMGPHGPYMPSNPQARMPGQTGMPGQGGMPAQGGMAQQYDPGGQTPQQPETQAQQPETPDSIQTGYAQEPADGTAAPAAGQTDTAPPDAGGQPGAAPSQGTEPAPPADQQPSGQ